MPDPQRYKLTVAYDGTAFHGWQRQEPAGQPVLRTGQGVLEDALVRVLRQPREELALLGASRTDAGVHAIGQVCHLNTTSPIPPDRMVRAINSRLPDDLEVRAAEVVAAEFDAIRDATDKQYRYRIFDAPYRPLGLRNLVYAHPARPALDLARMNDAAQRLVGTHDVEGFAAVAHGRATTVRTVYACRVEEHVLADAGRELHVVISGSGFLYNMVRIVAGTLVEVGRGAMEPSRVDEVLATQERRLAGPTLPPMGLCLEWVKHGPPRAALGDAEGSTPRRQDAKTPRKASGPETPGPECGGEGAQRNF